MDIVTFDPYISQERADQFGAELVDDLDDCLAKSDFITIHTPLTPETENMIGEDELALLEGGYVVNCARGGIIDEPALAEAVEDGVLKGAALDVFGEEPLPEDSPLLDVEDIIVTPHLARRRRRHRRTSPPPRPNRSSPRPTASPSQTP